MERGREKKWKKYDKLVKRESERKLMGNENIGLLVWTNFSCAMIMSVSFWLFFLFFLLLLLFFSKLSPLQPGLIWLVTFPCPLGNNLFFFFWCSSSSFFHPFIFPICFDFLYLKKKQWSIIHAQFFNKKINVYFFIINLIWLFE